MYGPLYDRLSNRLSNHPYATGFKAALLGVAVIVPLVAPTYIEALVAEALILAVYAIGLEILLGRTGLVSFGQAALYGSAGYVVALLLLDGVTTSAWLAMLLAVVGAIVAALLMGYISLQRRELYFALITLAIAQIFFVLAQQNVGGITNGTNGLNNIPHANFGVPMLFEVNLSPMGYYYFILIAFVAVLLLVKYVVNTNFGAVLVAIRENETRAKYAGYDVFRYKLYAFVVSAVPSGIAGSLAIFYFRTIDPSSLHWEMSGDALVVVLVGGMNTLYGALLGALTFVGIRDIATLFIADYEVVIGIVFIISIIFLPRGLISIFDIVSEKLKERK